MDVVFLSRLQFALTIMFHYLFPPLTIGLGVVLVYLEGMYLRTREPIFENAARFWTKIFGLNFALGVVTGIVMEFEFGTNWAAYSRYVGDVFGSALAAEGIFAFFLESGFLSLLLFGWDRIGPKMHFFATCMVALGGIFSSVWIVIANSWQQTPAGHVIREHTINGETFLRAEIVDFWALVFNPSTVNRLIHVWIGCFILGAFFVMSISAWYLLKGRHIEFAKRSFKGGLLLATISSLAQLNSGHYQAEGVAEHQPAKLAALEGVYKTEKGVGMYIFGWPDDETETVRFGLEIPGMLSFLVHGDFNAEVTGLDELEERWGRPPVWLTFQAYHIMVGIGMLFIGSTLVACFYWWRGTLFEQRWLLWYFVFAVGLAFVANELGWVAAEVGRQPWIVYPTVVNGELTGGLRTSDGISEAVRASQVLSSIIFFGLIYLMLFALWISLLHKKISHGPEPLTESPPEHKGTVLGAAAALRRHEHSLTEADEQSES
uniref:Cytochrome bd quinol oxidase subunit 1 apoprotein n=1 Tax=Rubinisphaera brasiliensis (strain ATCC 49424 / DSM 5305 / JCM 21570 / IAM 15109 / NBRC 103401 / IFAM 1448) TaxID=756272 RepID=F0SSC3_RUBBR|nr:cytochrome ubiquinol oxidase subunit I [Rubinisphaera brasiliensis]ADY59194.1 cytochrome bd quinol oxidase subunit 1 apoprotein [Rubinisphaera brasiliensis DSM 5305]